MNMYEINEYAVCSRICIAINEHTYTLCSGEVPVTLVSQARPTRESLAHKTTVTLYSVSVGYRLRGMFMIVHEYIFGIIEVQMKSRNPLLKPKILFEF